MSDPQTIDEFNARAREHIKTIGFGLETAQVYCCPFCAAADWATIKIIETTEELPKERGCNECGRTGKFLVTQTDEGGISLEFVQVGGPPPPEFLGFIRRADN